MDRLQVIVAYRRGYSRTIEIEADDGENIEGIVVLADQGLKIQHLPANTMVYKYPPAAVITGQKPRVAVTAQCAGRVVFYDLVERLEPQSTYKGAGPEPAMQPSTTAQS